MASYIHERSNMACTLHSIQIGSVTPSGAAEPFGHSLSVVLTLRYDPGQWVEPEFQWNETIFMLDHQKREYWKFDENMYKHRPRGVTFLPWRTRYVNAFEPIPGSGDIPLLGRDGKQVKFVGGQGLNDGQKAERVREYLAAHGGDLVIQIVDRPALRLPQPNEVVHRERLLLIECAITGSNTTVRWSQHLVVNSALQPQQWVRQANPFWNPQSLATPPGYVATFVPAQFDAHLENTIMRPANSFLNGGPFAVDRAGEYS